MKIISKGRIIDYVLVSLFALFAILFGGYLLYEKVLLSIASGHIHERAGTILRADDPIFFWSWVVSYIVGGTMIVRAGFWFSDGH